jgi:O-acetyl-ADP-ribose deacetylase (regulator of RNase III)
MTNVTTKVGDLLKSDAQTLVNTVNCIGVMGKGIALAFKRKFPDMFKDYEQRCARGEVRLGQPYLYKQSKGPWILNFPTKDHWRAVSRLSDIVTGLKYLKTHYKSWGITSLAVPPLGCGSGQLDWAVAGPTLYRYLSELDIPVALYAPHGTPPTQLELEFLARQQPVEHGGGSTAEIRVPPAAVALVAILSRVTREPYHWPIGRTTFQKIAYFAPEAGLPTGLRYGRGSFGPYSPQLKRIVAQLQNNGLLSEMKLAQMFIANPGPTYRDARAQYRSQLKEWRPAIERVADLFLRLQRTTDAEIAANVHYVAQELKSRVEFRPSELEVLEEVKTWKARRAPALDERGLQKRSGT